MPSRLVRALDARRCVTSDPTERRAASHVVLQRRDLSIREALEWAFGVEHAGLDFDEARGDNARPGVSPLWTVMQRGALGCKIDGGGWSAPARDADIIASAVAHLPAPFGGRRMALRIAELARAGQPEDWGRDLTPRCIPVALACENQYGAQSRTELVGYERVLARGGWREVEVRCCPVTYTASPARIASARAAWTAWRAALAHVGAVLAGQGTLDRVRIVPGLPEALPWVVAQKDLTTE